ncbi:MAG: hypothetical protein ACI4WF_02150 [Bacilli bacterium]
MDTSIFIVNDQKIEISNINYEDRCFSITTKEPKYTINISLKKEIDIKSLKINIKENISKDVYLDQHFITEKYSYVIAIKDNIYITKKSDNIFLFELYLPHVEILIPSFNNIKNTRENLSEKEVEIKKIEIKAYFNY